MKPDGTGFVYRVEMEIEVSRKEHAHLMELSKRHYDFKCQSISSPGKDSFLYGWQWTFQGTEEAETTKVRVTWGELDTLCKVLEGPGADPQLVRDVHDLLKRLGDETKRANHAAP